MLLNRHGQVFVARRIDTNRDAWQMPQAVSTATRLPCALHCANYARRSGLASNVEVIAESNGWFYYDVPTGMARKAWDGNGVDSARSGSL